MLELLGTCSIMLKDGTGADLVREIGEFRSNCGEYAKSRSDR